MMISGRLYAGLKAETYMTAQGDKVMGEDILNTATPEDLRKELQHYLSVDKTHRSWVSVTNIVNLHNKLQHHSTLENLTAMEMVSLQEVISITPPPGHELTASPALPMVSHKKRRCCVIS